MTIPEAIQIFAENPGMFAIFVMMVVAVGVIIMQMTDIDELTQENNYLRDLLEYHENEHFIK